MGGPMGIHVYHKKKGLGFESSQFRALITEILVGQDRVVYDGNGAASFKQHTLLYEQNNLTLSFSSDFYAADSKCAYRYQLVGADEQWSPWTENAKKEYTKLEEGEYTFRLQAKNVYGDLSATSELQFTVLPPWYRTFGAYLLYVFVFAVFVAMVLRMLTASLRWQKVRLENIVSERTWEIAQKSNEISSKNTELELQQSMILQQKENLELLNTELVRSNNAIRHSQGKMHDSLNYAQRIQMAMMPDDVLLNTLFKDFFVMWTPRDVVSGDFYMIRKLFIKGEMLKIIMVADCTGHGVPGAFVSMLGIAFLNEIIVDSMLWRCPKPAAEILEIMRVKIKSSLKQSVHGSGMKDGMDMSICIIREERAMVEFAGANSPIFLVRDALEDFSDLPSSARWLTSKDLNLVHLIPNKQPLGIYMKEYQFTSTTFTLKPNDRFYLFSDGFADQLGGEFQRKFQMNQFKQLILENAHLPMPAQQQVLTDTLKRWIANDYRQVDDILVVGIHL
jgi:serine phosphatase RsbU (regulator of sigma subunit)